jgi:hypothetical protein
MLDAFGLQQGGTQYRHLVGAFQRIFGASMFFGTVTQRAKAGRAATRARSGGDTASPRPTKKK